MGAAVMLGQDLADIAGPAGEGQSQIWQPVTGF
jgi:hypothetical protein